MYIVIMNVVCVSNYQKYELSFCVHFSVGIIYNNKLIEYTFSAHAMNCLLFSIIIII